MNYSTALYELFRTHRSAYQSRDLILDILILDFSYFSCSFDIRDSNNR